MEEHSGERRQEYPKLIERLTRLEEKLEASKSALELARQIMEVRLDGMNGIKSEMLRQENLFVTHKEAEAAHAVLQVHIDALRLKSAEMQGKANMSSLYVTYILSGIAILISLIHLVK